MKIKVVSDLHLEFSDINIKNDEDCDVLILSGDIMLAEDLHNVPVAVDPYSPGSLRDLNNKLARTQRFRDFLKRVSFQFTDVVYVAGNHELYHSKWFKGIDYLREECARYQNIHFLELDCVKIMDVTFVGGTLWTDMNKMDPLTLHAARDLMNDFRIIRNDMAGYTTVKPSDTVIRHKKTLDYIKNVVAEKHDEKFVVVSHHSPSFQSCHEFYKDDTIMNGCYHSSLEEFIMDRPQIKLWTHGHTHHPFDYMVGETRVVCNPRGYENDGYSEETGWNPNIIIEV